MFVNHTNHPSCFWSEKQLNVARTYGDILELPFPDISPLWGDEELELEIQKTLKKIEELQPLAILCQGEFVYSYRLIQELKKREMLVLAACSMRRVVETVNPDGTAKKESIFEFVKFREY